VLTLSLDCGFHVLLICLRIRREGGRHS
jgi:hypothetical protein